MREHRNSGGPVDQKAVRQHNLGLVLRHIAVEGPRSRATIALATGLNKTTVSSLVDELLGYGLLAETGTENPGAVGRPARRIHLSGSRVAALGLEIDVGYVAACATDLTGGVRYSGLVRALNRGAPPEEAIERVSRLAEEALDVLARERLVCAGATVALPGLVDVEARTLLIAPNLGWTETPVAELLHERLGRPPFPIRIDNDANLGALAELWEGVARDLRDFVYVEGGTGIGAGIVSGGELFRGAEGFGGELGHLTVQHRGARCGCGNRGCLELLAGFDAILLAAGIDADREQDPQAELLRRARAGDKRTVGALVDAARWLSIGLAALVNLFDPEAVIIGGYFAPLAEWMVPRIQRELSTRVLGARWSSYRLLVSALGGDAAVRGAAALSLHEIMANPLAVKDLDIVSVTN